MTHYIIVITDAVKPAARELISSLRNRPSSAFDVGLSPTGKLPCTHWWMGNIIADEEMQTVEQAIEAAGVSAQVGIYNSKDYNPIEILETLGLRTLQSTSI